MLYFFFFKQKTAYEMRISDWSSDVCSSDLVLELPAHAGDVRIGAIDVGVAQYFPADFHAFFIHLVCHARSPSESGRLRKGLAPRSGAQKIQDGAIEGLRLFDIGDQIGRAHV